MKRKWKSLIVLVCFLAIIVIVANWETFVGYIEYIYLSGTFIYLIILLVVGAVALFFVPWAELKLRFRMARSIREKEIPQWKRREIAETAVIKNWMSIVAAGGAFSLVSNFITPRRKDSQMWEQFTFTTNKAFSSKRIKEEDIDEKELFKVWVDCIKGDYFTQEDIKGSEETRKFTIAHWAKSLETKEEGFADKIMKRAMIEATGEELARREISKDKKEEETK